MIVRIDYVNATRGVRFGAEEREIESARGLYRKLQREFGRCQSAVFVDTKDGRTRRVGWVFVSRQTYDDQRGSKRADDTYLREVWVTLIEREIREDYVDTTEGTL